MDISEIAVYIAIGIGAYLIGSVSPAVIISSRIEKKDIRNYGSGNAGTTNMVRTFGWKQGLITFALDIAKGALAAFLGGVFGGNIGTVIGSVLVVLGHNYPIYYGFKGGKGIAATMGVFLVILPIQTLVALAIVLPVIALTRYVSVGSILGVLLEAIGVFIFYPEQVHLQIAVCILAAMAIFGHRTNIVRLCKGRENRLSFHSSKKV